MKNEKFNFINICFPEVYDSCIYSGDSKEVTSNLLPKPATYIHSLHSHSIILQLLSLVTWVPKPIIKCTVSFFHAVLSLDLFSIFIYFSQIPIEKI